MATRFRLTSDATTPSVSPAFQSYTHSGSGVRRLLKTSDASALTTITLNPDDPTEDLNDGDTLFVQFCYQLGANTFTSGDAFDLAIQGLEEHSSNNLFVQVWMGVYSSDGSTLQGTIRSKLRDGTEMGTGLINRYLSGTLDGSYSATNGEWLVVEFAIAGDPTAAGGLQGHNGRLRFGSDGSSGDLPEDDAQTGNTWNPWLEFANTIAAYDPGGGGGNRRRRVLIGGMAA